MNTGINLNMKIRTDDNYTIVRLYDTDIVKFNDKKIILNTGGYNTVTTRANINAVSRAFNLQYEVNSVDKIWRVKHRWDEFNWPDSHILIINRGNDELTKNKLVLESIKQLKDTVFSLHSMSCNFWACRGTPENNRIENMITCSRCQDIIILNRHIIKLERLI